MTGSARWDDLGPRAVSGVAIAVVGIGALVAGDPWLSALAAAAGGVMIWELSAMTAPGRPREAQAMGLLAAIVLAALFLSHNPFALAWLLIPVVIGVLRPRHDRWGFAIAAFAMLMATYAIVAFRGGFGVWFVLWFALLVTAADTAAYFGGRTIGGPKFWPRLSPKKTWSGAVAGWLGAALVGAAFWAAGMAPVWIVPFSALVAFASQMGDIGESAVKRRAGVKDASHLIPGHGGLMDRLDALSGAALFLLAWGMVLPLPRIGA